MSRVSICDIPSIGQPPFSSPRDDDPHESREWWFRLCHNEGSRALILSPLTKPTPGRDPLTAKWEPLMLPILSPGFRLGAHAHVRLRRGLLTYAKRCCLQ